MTRDQLVSYITTQTQQLQPNDIAACQEIVATQYEIIYNQELWKDSLTLVTLDFDPVNNPDNANGVLFLPQQIDHVVAVRTTCNSVRVNNIENYYRVDYDAFTANQSNFFGAAAEFAILPPVWAMIQVAANPWGADILVPGIYSNLPFAPFGGGLAPGVAVGTIIKYTPGANEIGVTGLGFAPVTGTTYIFSVPDNAYHQLVITGTLSSPFSGTLEVLAPSPATQTYGPGSTITLSSSSSADGANAIKVIWRDTQEQYVQTLNLPVTLTPPDGQGYVELIAVFLPSTIKGVISVQINNAGIVGVDNNGNATTLSATLAAGLSLAIGVTASPKYQRIRIFAIPTATTSIYVLGKRPCIPLDFGSEVPAIKNIDNCLIAFGMARMLERARQFGKAQQKLSEASGLLKQLVEIEAVQSANYEQFKPDSGYGDAFFSPNGIGYRGGIF